LPEHRFAGALDRLVPDGLIGLAVSGGPDSLALLLLAAEARPGKVAAATVDHGLRPEGAAEALMVADRCRELGVPHRILSVTVEPGSSPMARARSARYRALGEWARAEGMSGVATAHHLDDQAETLLMRLLRGSGLSGLAGIRETSVLGSVPVVRPLLSFRKAELVRLVEERGWLAADDPSNADPRFDRVRARRLMALLPALAPQRLARTAAALAEAEDALSFVTGGLAADRLRPVPDGLEIDVSALPRELRRRLLVLAMTALEAAAPGPEVERALLALEHGRSCTLAGLLLQGSGDLWRLGPEPPRRSR
jgi:tRNA(Ile)-lysidine synthase